MGTYTHEEGAEGFATVEQAVRDWMTNGDGAHPQVNASALELVIEQTGRASLVDGDGHVRVVVIAHDVGNGWLVATTERCVDS